MSFSLNNIPDQTGKVIIVTGANSGIGFETSKALSDKGATVILACRDKVKANHAVIDLKKTSKGHVEAMRIDLSDLFSIHNFLSEFRKKYDRLDVLVNNAAVMAIPFSKTAQGLETTFATNHLGPFVLTFLLSELLLKTRDSRVITVSSLAHRYGKIDFENLNGEKKFNKNAAYSQSKLANLLFSMELSQRFKQRGGNTLSIAVHPGWTITNLQAHTPLFTFLNPFFGQKPKEGALSSIYAATIPNIKSGDYFGPSGWSELHGHPKRVEMSKLAQDGALAKKLWEISEHLTGVEFA